VTGVTARSGKTTVELRLDARAENLALARLALAGVAAHAGASRDVVSDLKLAVTEACTNVIKHAYGNTGEPGVVVVRYTVARGMLSIEVEDAGCGFEATAAPESPAENGGGNGMGLTIIRVLTDELSIESADPGTRLTFVKRFSPES
jgi:serine/threonine-protein kinase RsbW